MTACARNPSDATAVPMIHEVIIQDWEITEGGPKKLRYCRY